MQKISQYNGFYLFHFETLVEKENFKKAIKAFPGVVDLSDRDTGRTLRIKVIQDSLADNFLRDFQCRRSIKFDKEDLNYYLHLILKHPLLKLGISVGLLGAKVGILSFLICSQIMMPFIKKTL
ncbi:MAG: hypothetical protein N2Z40_02405 [Caldimicrobium sp.]|nr:hypothetical protein [Caldimicrobium sp.]MCX7613062.1 hypothetical protein [Caldimicrobium sp.]MDW8182787.1 hypothetical protein [Caldimicrobium sp.]